MKDKSKKYEEITASFPGIQDLNWNNAISSDEEIFVRLLGDVIKSGGRGSKPGKRPTLDRAAAEEQFAQLAAADFSEMPFTDAFRALCGKRSVRHVASLTDLSKTGVQDLMTGRSQPSFNTIEKIAKGFKKHPSYFLEYRIGFVVAALAQFLENEPEVATTWFLKVGRR